MSTIELVGQSLRYDAVEALLASGGSFATAMALAAHIAESGPVPDDDAPVSSGSATTFVATLKSPGV